MLFIRGKWLIFLVRCNFVYVLFSSLCHQHFLVRAVLVLIAVSCPGLVLSLRTPPSLHVSMQVSCQFASHSISRLHFATKDDKARTQVMLGQRGH
jgi:hypothetical protein